MLLLLQGVSIPALPAYGDVVAASRSIGIVGALLILMVLFNMIMQLIDMWNRSRLEVKRNDLLMTLNSAVNVLLDRKLNHGP